MANRIEVNVLTGEQKIIKLTKAEEAENKIKYDQWLIEKAEKDNKQEKENAISAKIRELAISELKKEDGNKWKDYK